MSTHQRHTGFPARLPHLLKYGLNAVAGDAFGKKRRHQQPSRLGTRCGEIVTVNCQEVSPEVLRGKGDGIRFRHQKLGAA
jgi:hypothetical protein